MAARQLLRYLLCGRQLGTRQLPPQHLVWQCEMLQLSLTASSGIAGAALQWAQSCGSGPLLAGTAAARWVQKGASTHGLTLREL